MKLSSLYSSDDTIFQRIDFHEGLNLIVGHVTDPNDETRTSHCLGKSLLIDLIDFCLLKQITKKHFLKSRADLFNGLEFFLEINLHSGGFLTIRRQVDTPTKIAFQEHQSPQSRLVDLPEENWQHSKIPLKKAVEFLDSTLALSAIRPWSYRKGVGYFTRRQADYQDPFRLEKYASGRHKEWKPYIAKILGLDEHPLIEKYKNDEEQERIKIQLDEAKSDIVATNETVQKLKARIVAKTSEIDTKTEQLDAFDLAPQENAVSRELAETIEGKISLINSNIYNIRIDLETITSSLERKSLFDLAAIQQIFEESAICFPDAMAKDYTELVDFSKKISIERASALKKKAIALKAELTTSKKELATLSLKRKNLLGALVNTGSLSKFKLLQKSLDEDRAHLELLEEKKRRAENAAEIDRKYRAASTRSKELGEQVRDVVNKGSDRCTTIQTLFSRNVDTIIARSAVLYPSVNNEGNIEYDAEYTANDSTNETLEGRGTTFKKVLCIAYDLALLEEYSSEGFFHFVYHDGFLEQLEERRKLSLLFRLEELASSHGIQYIGSALEEDFPDDDAVTALIDSATVLRLNDSGASGRLFKTAKF